MKRILSALAVASVATVGTASVARADTWGISVYGGWNGSFNSDVNFTGPSTNWTVRNVPWDGLSFTFTGAAPYYGARLSYWPTAMPGWAFALDYTHAKVQASRNATVSYSGEINGGSVSGSGTVSSLFDVLEFTDGLNIVTLNALYKLPSFGMVHPYVGAGAGINIPHVEVTGNGGSVPFARTFDYEFGGLALQALVGAEVAINKRLALFGEYKLNWAGVNSPLNGGYRIHTNVVTNHILAGVTLKFGP